MPNTEEKYTDETEMISGKFKGVKLANVPAAHLLWLDESGYTNKQLHVYIKENFEALKKEAYDC